MVIVTKYEKITGCYSEKGFRYIYMEAGHVGHNVYLDVTEFGLGTVAVGVFNDEEVLELIGLGED